MKMLQLFSHFRTTFFYKDFKSLFDNVLGQYGINCNGVDWWGGLNKVRYSIGEIDIGRGNITEVTGTINHVYPYHGLLIGSLIIVFDGEGIMQAVSFSTRK